MPIHKKRPQAAALEPTTRHATPAMPADPKELARALFWKNDQHVHTRKRTAPPRRGEPR